MEVLERWIVRKPFVSLLLISMIVSIASCGSRGGSGSGGVERPIIKGVETQRLKAISVVDFYETTGTVRSINTVYVSSRIMGEVERVFVREGDHVRKGDELIRIKAPDIGAKVLQAEEMVKEAEKLLEIADRKRRLTEKTFKRYEGLFKEGVITAQQYDEVKTEMEIARLDYMRAERSLEKARAGLKEARAFYGYTVILSPVNGVVSEKFIDEGSMAGPGRTLVLIEEPLYRVEAPVDEGLEGIVRKDMAVSVEIESRGLLLEGMITEIVHQIDPSTRTFIIKVSLPEDIPLLKGGLSAKVRIPTEERMALLVPQEAVIRKGEIRAVYVVDDRGIVKMRLVRTGREMDGSIEILSGLEEGETIVVGGLERVVDGGILGPLKGESL